MKNVFLAVEAVGSKGSHTAFDQEPPTAGGGNHFLLVMPDRKKGKRSSRTKLSMVKKLQALIKSAK